MHAEIRDARKRLTTNRYLFGQRIAEADWRLFCTLAGSAGNPGSDDGTGSEARFNGPAGVALDSAGTVYVADTFNHTIRRSYLTPPPTSATLLNISTRMRVETGDNVLIDGFIITGPAGSTKRVVIRGIGPSLNVNGVPVPGRLTDPLIELHNPDGSTVTNDNWQDAPNAAEIPGGLQPTDLRESVILTTLAPGGYTAIVKGAHGETGVGLVEAFDLEQASLAKLANISTRGFVQTRDNVMIGGFIISGTSGSTTRVIVRTVGPSLPVPGTLTDPTLELHDGNGALVAFNDNWRSDQEAAILATGLAPTDNRESAILRTLTLGGYTAIVRGSGNSIGVALVEAFQLNN